MFKLHLGGWQMSLSLCGIGAKATAGYFSAQRFAEVPIGSLLPLILLNCVCLSLQAKANLLKISACQTPRGELLFKVFAF